MEYSPRRKSDRKKRRRHRKCRNCREFFVADCRNRKRQAYCSKPSCRQASKRAAQRRWLSSSKGQGYFQGSWNVDRVRRWRAAHPGYGKRSVPKAAETLQDLLPSQVTEKAADMHGMGRDALQDLCSLQPALIVGLIANLTGSTLQDEIAQTSRRFIDSGLDILQCASLHRLKGGPDNGGQTNSLSGSSSSSSATVQLGGSSSGSG